MLCRHGDTVAQQGFAAARNSSPHDVFASAWEPAPGFPNRGPAANARPSMPVLHEKEARPAAHRQPGWKQSALGNWAVPIRTCRRNQALEGWRSLCAQPLALPRARALSLHRNGSRTTAPPPSCSITRPPETASGSTPRYPRPCASARTGPAAGSSGRYTSNRSRKGSGTAP